MFSDAFQILIVKRAKDKIKQSAGLRRAEIGAEIRAVESSETASSGTGPQWEV